MPITNLEGLQCSLYMESEIAIVLESLQQFFSSLADFERRTEMVRTY